MNKLLENNENLTLGFGHLVDGYMKKKVNLSIEFAESMVKIHSYYDSNCKEELKIAEGNISENETLDTYLAAQDDNKEDNEDDDIETSLLEEENNDINVNEGLPYLSEEETILANDKYDKEEEYNLNELASSFMTALLVQLGYMQAEDINVFEHNNDTHGLETLMPSNTNNDVCAGDIDVFEYN
ncbi:6455_t:CDS:2 [Entrophospora sp. SA101]|nr:6455_t:CDS:2 [Entrophospora sp. SA101]